MDDQFQSQAMTKKPWIPIVGVLLLVILIVLFVRGCGKDDVIEVKEAEEKVVAKGEFLPYDKPANASPITGEACDNYNKRAFGVMLNGDESARKYFANITLADFVAEVPHRAEHGQPRILAVYGCNTPETIGPMRSGRVDHISIATSLDAVYVPWGGSSIAKALLKKGGIDQIDCNGEVAPVGGNACFRRPGPMTQLQKASTSIPKLIDVAQANNIRGENNFSGFEHQGELPRADRPNYSKVAVKYQDPYRVEYLYNPDTNSYDRFFQNQPDVDFETKKQHSPKNLITIIVKKEAWHKDVDYVSQGLQDPWAGVPADAQNRDTGQYPNMQLGDPWFDRKFEGEARFFFNGQEVDGFWKRQKSAEAPFEFFDENNQPIHFVPGQIWMHVLGHSRRVSHTDEAEHLEKLEEARVAAPAGQ